MSERHRLHRLRGLWLLPLLALIPAIASCGGSSSATSSAPVIAKDALGTAITIPDKAPQRIITLLPSDSDIVAALGADDRVVGVDAYTIAPADLAAKPKVSDASTGNLNIEQIVALKPDLVLSYGGASWYGKQEQPLLTQKINVVDLPAAVTVQDTLTEFRLVGQLLHEDAKAQQLVASYQQRIDAVTAKVKGKSTPSVYLENYGDPSKGQYYAFGKGTFGDDIIHLAGGINAVADANTNNGALSAEAIVAAKPDVIALAEDPQYGGDPKAVASRAGWSAIPAVQNHHVYDVNPDYFSHPDAASAVAALEQLAKDLHPDSF